MELTAEEKKILLDAARNSIRSLFTNEKIPRPDFSKHHALKLNAGAFVTLTKSKSLRGCIGYIISDDILFNTVCNAAVQAAEFDPRFSPVTEKEVDSLSIEISVLSPPFMLNSYEEIELGKHGLILEEKGRRGLLLPQVPIEHNLNKEQYLEAICQKTNLPSDYWKTRQLKLSGFTALVFNEEELEIK